MEATTVGTNTTTIPIAITADVSKTDAFVKREGNLTYFEHSINFNIPTTVKPGNYHAVFFDKSTNTKLPIPIEIRPAAVPTSTGIKTQSTELLDILNHLALFSLKVLLLQLLH